MQRSRDDRRAVRPGRLDARHRLVETAHIGEPFLLLMALPGELARPGDAAIERADHERHARLAAAPGERACRRGAERRHAVDDVIFPGADIGAEALPDHPLEQRIGERLDGGHGRPALALAAAQQVRDLPERRHQRLGIDRGEVAPFHQPGALERLLVADLRDDVDVRLPAQRCGERPADQRHAHPFGICLLGDQQNAMARRHGLPFFG